MQAIHDSESAAGNGQAKSNLDKIESEINVQKRNLMQMLSKPEYEGRFEMTKAVLLQTFIVPQSINKREFAPDSKIIMIAADMNQAFHELTEKREILQRSGLGYRLEEMKKKGDKSLFDEKLLAQYNLIAQQEWHDRLLEELLHGRKISEIQRKQEQINGKMIETDYPDQDPEEIAPDWLETQKEAEELVKKYGMGKPGIGEPHIIDQVNHAHQKQRENSKFEKEFREGLNPEKPKSKNKLESARNSKKESESQNIKQGTNFPTRPTKKDISSEDNINSIKNNHPSTPNIHTSSKTSTHKTPSPTSSHNRSMNKPESAGRGVDFEASNYRPPDIRAAKQEINDVLGDSFPVDDFNELSDTPLADDDMAMFMPDSQLRTVGVSQVKESRVEEGKRDSPVLKPPPKMDEFEELDLGDFDDLDDYERHRDSDIPF